MDKVRKEAFLAKFSEARQEKSTWKLKGELEKNPEELEAINLIKAYLLEELAEMGLQPRAEITSDKIHF